MGILSHLAQGLVFELDKESIPNDDKKISVNPVVAEVASWYEKIRNAMDYRDEEVILRAAIERILKRRMIFTGKGEEIARPLVRELAWARYFPDRSVSEASVDKVAERINLYLKLSAALAAKKKMSRELINEWVLHLMSADITYIIHPNRDVELMSNFLFHVFKNKIAVIDDSEEVRDVQTFIAVRRAFAKEDLALLRFHLFQQFFGRLNSENVEKVAESFIEGFQRIQYHLQYPLKDKFYAYVKRNVASFFILQDVFRKYQGQLKTLVSQDQELEATILSACSARYKAINSKVKTAIIRSVIFLFATKALFGLGVEGSFENIFYGKVIWRAIGLNTMMPPVLMLLSGLFIKVPGRANSTRILERIRSILFDSEVAYLEPVALTLHPKSRPILYASFALLWWVAALIGFGAIVVILNKLHFSVISQVIFLFFLAIVSFLSYRINQTAKVYSVGEEKQNIGTILFDFFFMPFIQVGRSLTMGISQFNIFLFLLDFVIETPFKGMFAFFEHWFYFLRTQHERLE